MTLPLTPKQERLWRYIRQCRLSPSYAEMCAHMGCASKANINRLLTELKRRGFVAFDQYHARTVVALDPAADLKTYPTEALQAELERRAAL